MLFLLVTEGESFVAPPVRPYGFGAAGGAGDAAAGGATAAAAPAGGLPEEPPKNLKKSESGFSRKRVSLLFSPFSYAVIER